MKKNFYWNVLGCSLAALTMVGCEKAEEVNPDFTTGVNQNLMDDNCYAINFEEYTAEDPENLPFIDHVTTPFGKVAVKNTHRSEAGVYADVNVARIYDTMKPTGDDAHDLGKATALGKILVANQFTQQEIAENPDGTYAPSGHAIRIAGPNDNAWGATMELDFTGIEGNVTMQSIDVVDIDATPLENKSIVRLVVAGGSHVDFPLATYEEEGSIQTVDLKGTKNVEKLIVMLDGEGNVGSGGIDNIMFCTETAIVTPPATGGCTRTQGYWKTHADSNNEKKYDDTWDDYHSDTFFKSGFTYYTILLEQPKGNAYYILAHQYVAATLNMAAGAGMSGEALEAYNKATDLFKAYAPSQITKKDKKLHEKFTSLASTLDKYNNGIIGPGHCD
ncbi:hypothetical protein [Pontibacter anaerobius]|uniref:DUF4856 domain-containing protein n=1 Tax=Pontibacter anaerobius TaxID=2993940 RepID=A0ABT3RDY5_9BACT|nr:hypothetical protein [Pontibacter anaerobius]MCX2739644.1 hypothetical protein [Pontibacter anaerobius]